MLQRYDKLQKKLTDAPKKAVFWIRIPFFTDPDTGFFSQSGFRIPDPDPGNKKLICSSVNKILVEIFVFNPKSRYFIFVFNKSSSVSGPDPDPPGSGFKSQVWIQIRSPDPDPAIQIELFLNWKAVPIW